MTPRERVGTVLTGGIPDRVPFQDAYWATTVERWRREGLPAGVAPEEHFDCEIARIGGDYSLQLPHRVIEETERYRIYTDADGATRKELQTADGWTPHWLDFSIKTADDWRRLRDRGAYNPGRISGRVEEIYRRARERDRFIAYSVHACFHPTWHKTGLETLLIWMHEKPDLVDEMFATHTRLIVDLYQGLRARGIEFDGVWVSDDLGYRAAPLISPEMYRERVMPHHRSLCERFARDGLRTILHSDGDVGPLIPLFLEAGFAALHPLEAKAGLDVRDLKPRYGDRLVLFGNIDARVLARTREEIEEESRATFAVAKEGGGYLYHSDHSVPSDVSLQNYRFAVEAVRRLGTYS